jgi:hypothetical protein
MINPVTGEVDFDGVVFWPHQAIDRALESIDKYGFERRADSPRQGLTTVVPHACLCHNKFGQFHVECTFDPDGHLVLVTASHKNSFYQKNTPNDKERCVYHENIVSEDLAGQREFGWGEVLFFLCEITNRHHLGIFYTPGPGVPLSKSIRPVELQERKSPAHDS